MHTQVAIASMSSSSASKTSKDEQMSIDQFLTDAQAQLQHDTESLQQSMTTDNQHDNKMQIALSQYRHAALLSSLGMQRESMTYFRQAWDTACLYIPTLSMVLKEQVTEPMTVYSRVAYSIGVDYVNILDYLAETAECERVFTFLNNCTYNEGPHLGDYAFFLHRRKRDFDNAEKTYKRAIELFPDHSSIYLKYAGFLRHVRRNMISAEEYYKLAAALCDDGAEAGQAKSNLPRSFGSNAADAFGNYASFLHGVHHKTDQAEYYYKKAVEADETHANNLCNYGLFLSEEKKDFVTAESMYRQVLKFTPNHANTLYNYAVLLDTHLKMKNEAEAHYRQTLEIEPKHAFALYNLAVLLEEKTFSAAAEQVPEEQLQSKIAELHSFYKRAAEADPKDPTTLADYGRYVYVRMNNHDLAEPLLMAALKLDGSCEVALYHLGILVHRERKNVDAAEMILKKLLAKNPQHGNGNLGMARVKADKVQASYSKNDTDKMMDHLQDAIELYEKSVLLVKEPVVVVSEYLKFINMFGNNRQKLNAIKTMNPHILASEAANKGDSIRDQGFSSCRDMVNEMKAILQI